MERRLNVVVADEDPEIVGFVIRTLRAAGFAAFHAFDGIAAVELSLELKNIHLLISNTRIRDMPGVELIHTLRAERPKLAVIYLANIGRSSPEIEAQLPADVPILREPFSADELLALVRRLALLESDRRRNTETEPQSY